MPKESKKDTLAKRVEVLEVAVNSLLEGREPVPVITTTLAWRCSNCATVWQDASKKNCPSCGKGGATVSVEGIVVTG